MKKSSHMIEWLQTSEFAIRTPVKHMFWVCPTEIFRRSDGRKQVIGDLCYEIEQQLRDERQDNSFDQLQDWYVWNYHLSNGEERCVFTQMPPVETNYFNSQPCTEEQLIKIKRLLQEYKRAKEWHNSGRILATEGVLSWIQNGTGLQWTSFSYLQSHRKDHAEVLNKLCYAGYNDWRIPTISDIRAMLSADKERLDSDEHPLADCFPKAMPLPIAQTPEPFHSLSNQKGYYIFEKETTVTTGTRYNRSDERIDIGGYHHGKFLAVRGQRKVSRNWQTPWAGTLLEWSERSMTLVEQGQLPGSSAGWKRLESLRLRGAHLNSVNIKAAFAAMTYLDNLKDFWITMDEFCHEIPESLYKLSQVKELRISNRYSESPDVTKWSITSVSSEIENMKDLETIHFERQVELTRVPDEIFDLPNLTSLHLGGCWKLVLSGKQIKRACELAESGVFIDIPPFEFLKETCRAFLLQVVKDNEGEIDWPILKALYSEK